MNGAHTVKASLPSPACPPGLLKVDEKDTRDSFEKLQEQIINNRRYYAEQMVDLFSALERMTETEFFEIVSTLHGDGLQIGALIEKFRKFKKS